jgi:hypothetical protein
MLWIDELEFEQCVKRTKWRIHHSIVSPPRVEPIKYLVNHLNFFFIICNHGHWFVNCPIRFDVWDLIKGKTKTYVNEKSIPIYNCYDEHADYCDNKTTCFLLIKKPLKVKGVTDWNLEEQLKDTLWT